MASTKFGSPKNPREFPMQRVTVYWATTLGNVMRGYNVKTHSFSKDELPFLEFHDCCYFVQKQDLQLGIEKAKRILDTHPDVASAICVLEARFPRSELFPNDTGGFGMFRLGSTFPVSALFLVINGHLEPFSEKDLRALQQQKGGEHEYP